MQAQHWLKPGIVLFIIAFSISCQKDIDTAPLQTLELHNPQQPGNATFIIETDNLIETPEGYNFSGLLSTKNSQDIIYPVGRGQYNIRVAPGGAVMSIQGVGIAQFPQVGLFADLLKTHDWKLIKAHIEYETGQYYLDKYGTEVPLEPHTRYLSYLPYDEAQDGSFELNEKLNRFRKNFRELYIDPLDPAILMKAEIAFPEEPIFLDFSASGFIFWQAVAQLTTEAAGEVLGSFPPLDVQLIAGLSNQGIFRSKPYAFNLLYPSFFRDRFGFDAFEEAPSHYYVRLKDVAIPGTYDLLQATGELYYHLPTPTLFPQPKEIISGNHEYLLDFLTGKNDQGYFLTLNGAIDPLGNFVADGIFNVLPELNEVLGVELFSEEDIDLEFAAGTFQLQRPGIIAQPPAPAFTRFGGQLKLPVLDKLFSPNINQYIKPFLNSAVDYSSFLYLTVGAGPADAKLYIEEGTSFSVPFFEDLALTDCMYFIDTSGIEMLRNKQVDLGPIILDQGISGKINQDGFLLTGQVTHQIDLNNTLHLDPVSMEAEISSASGISLEGEIRLPYGMGLAQVSGTLRNNIVSMSGSLKAGANLELANGLKLPLADMTVSAQSNKGITLTGKANLPHIGWINVSGNLTSDELLLEGTAASGFIRFGNVTTNFAAASIQISKNNGIRFRGAVNLDPFGMIVLTGPVNREAPALSGTFIANVNIGGHVFQFTDGRINTSQVGVNIRSLINVYFSRIPVEGPYNDATDFLLKGVQPYTSSLLKLSIGISVYPDRVALTGSGKAYGPLGNELYSGTFGILPDWNNRRVRACYRAGGRDFCYTL